MLGLLHVADEYVFCRRLEEWLAGRLAVSLKAYQELETNHFNANCFKSLDDESEQTSFP